MSDFLVLNAADRKLLQTKKIGILGFGAQGTATAKNLRKSEVSFQLGLRKGSPSWERAVQAGFEPKEALEVVKSSEILFFNIPDQLQASYYIEAIRGQAVKTLIFAHGFSTHFGFIPVEKSGPDHVLIATKGAAVGLEKYYGTKNSLPALLAFQSADRTRTEADTILIETLARALGAHPRAMIWAEFKDEAVSDLFSEQVVLCGGISSLLRRSFEVLVEGGYKPEAAYFETLFELKLIVDLIWENGITGMRDRISPTARYGDVTRGDRIADETVKNKMREILKEIESGEFAKEFLAQINSENFKTKLKSQAEHPLEKIGKTIREKLSDVSL